MENPPGIYLEAAIATWRQELLAQPNLASADRSELEVHLRDLIAELRALGLSDEEAFLVARRRVGPPQQIAEEFFKADPARVWRERVFWMAVVLLVMNIWGGMMNLLVDILREFIFQQPGLPSWLFYPVTNLLLHELPLLGVALFLSFGFIAPEISWMHTLFRSRARFVLVSTVTVIAIEFCRSAILWLPIHKMVGPTQWRMILQNFAYMYWPLILIAVIAWLMPAPFQSTPAQRAAP